MKFITPCFVRVENIADKEELLQWLVKIGYIQIPNGAGEWRMSIEVCCYITCSEQTLASVTFWACSYRYCRPTYGRDCGENIALFKALAALNYENDREQWYSYTEYPTDEGKNGVRKFVFNEHVRFDSFVDVPSGYYRKATAEEIVEYFKNK